MYVLEMWHIKIIFKIQIKSLQFDRIYSLSYSFRPLSQSEYKWKNNFIVTNIKLLKV